MAEKIVLDKMYNLSYMDINIIPIVESYIYDTKTHCKKVYVGLNNDRKIIVTKYRTRYDKMDGPYKKYEYEEKVKRRKENIYFIETGNYSNGKLHGKIKKYYSFDGSGKISREEHYKEGKEHGIFKEFDKEGNLIRKDKYNNGVRDGESLWYYPTGIIRERITYNNGIVKERKIYWENGQLNKICGPFGEQLHGEIKEWYDNGNIMSVKLYNKGEIIDEKQYHKDGRPMKKVGGFMWV